MNAPLPRAVGSRRPAPGTRPGARAAKSANDSSTSIVNALTIDVEDYFQVSAFSRHIDRSDWARIECRVERNVDRILALLADAGATATFFTLGWIAERYPLLVRGIADAGHEVASHGFAHERATGQSRGAFRADVSRAKTLLENVIGREVLGYRAPSFSIGRDNDWAFDVLAEVGYRYSSSIYPIKHDHYGVPDAPRFAHEVRPGLLEVPVATVCAWRRNWPAGGGGYFRLMPYSASKWSIKRIHARDRQPVMFYFHPWELDPDQPRIPGLGMKTRFRHYVNLHRTAPRLTRLLSDFRWRRADEIFLTGNA